MTDTALVDAILAREGSLYTNDPDDPGGPTKYGRPTRPGFYCIKYPVMASRAANAVARWKAIRWVYPEELCP